MVQFILRCLARFLLWLRYRVEVRGLREVGERGTRGIAFLPNHPALIDPILLMTVLHKRFRPRALADQDQVDRFFIRWVARRVGVLTVPSVAKHGPGMRAAVEQALGEAIAALRRGENLLLYPAGHAQRTWREDLRGNSGVERLLREAPEARLVLVRTTGLWGSSFSWASGHAPSVRDAVRRGAVSLLLSGLFFAPRRRVTIELAEPADLPRGAPREALNAYLETFYNATAKHNTYVPYTPWSRGGVRELPEPEPPPSVAGPLAVPASTRAAVMAALARLAGRDSASEEQHLAADLGLDSLARADILAWLEAEFGLPQGDADALATVRDVLLAACGQAASSEMVELRPIRAAWFRRLPHDPPPRVPRSQTITGAFLEQARATPGRAIVADQTSGVKTYRDIALAVLLLRSDLQSLPGDRLGIMMPASVAATVAYLATLFAGKTPVMVNWTLGPRNLAQALDLAGVRTILTLTPLVQRLEAAGHDFASVRGRFVFLDEIARRAGRGRKLWALLKSRLPWASLDAVKPSDTAAILFTSGSEALPKAVPLSHQNVLRNLASVLQIVPLTQNDKLMGFLPPFHAFGITVTMLAPLCYGLPTVYHPNPTEGAALARVIGAYGATVLIGTPTFLNGILRAATRASLASVRLAVTGAEKCPDQVYDAFAALCPNAVLLEGYGVTECSPIVTVTDPASPRRGAIGRLLPAFERLLTHPETGDVLSPPATGLLLVRGPCVFNGYLNYDGPSPFVEAQGRTWYRTGDIVSEDAAGVFTFCGRLKRFVKRGGEMISLPAIEAVIAERCVPQGDQGPLIAVEATPHETNPELVLFTAVDADREAVNAALRAAGLSALHTIRRVIRVPQIPLLGTGKTDYRALKALLASESAAAR
ncbi:MAG TPA: AMP-binding protein [Planctomycetota bacterium]|nr:AMP-binding protein [Planctomycetota bacterium]HRR81204.1 AMP-binding protein [Planctomycetota bacterium]HRT95212.1 AMP-binding protein [Planctomycetota bacterium]